MEQPAAELPELHRIIVFTVSYQMDKSKCDRKQWIHTFWNGKEAYQAHTVSMTSSYIVVNQTV
jgi:hypothetical protein